MPIRTLGVIPARYASSRFQGKALVEIAGKPMLQHVYERAAAARYLTKIVIATDDERIARASRAFGAPVTMTREDHPSGTDRVAEAASSDPADLVVNIQGDEPLIDPAAIDAAVLALLDDETAQMGTLARRIDDPEDINDPNVVKVVWDRAGDALYFSRSPIPYVRESSRPGEFPYFRHIGLYVYRKKFLLDYPTLPPGPLERLERLEQLRALENGFRIRVVETDYMALGVDTPEDLVKVARLFQTPVP